MLASVGNKYAENDGATMANILQVHSVGFEDKYLGFPVLEGRTKRGKFQSMKDRVMKRCTDRAEYPVAVRKSELYL